MLARPLNPGLDVLVVKFKRMNIWRWLNIGIEIGFDIILELCNWTELNSNPRASLRGEGYPSYYHKYLLQGL